MFYQKEVLPLKGERRKGLDSLLLWFDILSVCAGGAICRQNKAMNFCLCEADFKTKDVDQQR